MGMKYSFPRMGRLHGKVEFRPLFVKFSAPRYEFKYSFRSFFNKNLYRIFPAETVTRPQGILKMDAHFILITQGNGNTSLRIFGTAFSRPVFCNNKDTAVWSKFYRSPEARNTTSYNKKIHISFFI